MATDYAPQAQIPPYQRLLGALTREFSRLHQHIEELSLEKDWLRSENRELRDLLNSGLREAERLKDSILEEGSDVDDGEGERHVSSLLTIGNTPRSHWTINSCTEVRNSTKSLPPAPLMSTRSQASTREVTFVDGGQPPDDMSSPKATFGEAMAGDMFDEDALVVDTERLKCLKEQFDRLDRHGRGKLSVQDCWAVVSHQERLQYGHVKHEFTRVCKTLKYITGEKGVCHPRTTNSDVGLDFNTYVDIMNRAPSLEDNVSGEDMAYLRKAFQWESNEFYTQQARQNIAARHQHLQDARPTGLLMVILETLPPFVISFNALVIGLATDIDSPVWNYLEKVFLSFYALEFVLKLRLLGCKRYFLGLEGRWNTFDFVCLCSGVVDEGFEIARMMTGSDLSTSSLLPLLKVLRLARLARIVRSFRYKIFESLKSMVSGVFSGARVLGWSIVLLFGVVYVMGVFMCQVVGDQFQEFQNIPSAMFTVFRCFTDGCAAYNGTPLQERLRMALEQEGFGGIFMIGYILMFLIVTVGVFNLIMAIFIDNVTSTTVKRKMQELGAREDEMRINLQHMVVRLMKSTAPEVEILQKFRRHTCAATDGGLGWLRASGVVITRDLFSAWLTDPDMLSMLDDMEIDTATKHEIFDVCDIDKSGSLTPDELISGLMRLRGPISKCDVIAVRLKVRYLTDMLEDIHNNLGL